MAASIPEGGISHATESGRFHRRVHHDVVAVVVRARAVVAGAGDQPKLRPRDVRVHPRGAELLLRVLRDLGDEESGPRAVGARDDDFVTRLESLEFAEDAVGTVPPQMAGQHCWPNLTRGWTLGEPTDGLRPDRHLHRAVGHEPEFDGSL